VKIWVVQWESGSYTSGQIYIYAETREEAITKGFEHMEKYDHAGYLYWDAIQEYPDEVILDYGSD